MEVWKDIIGYEGFYQISNLGKIKSLDKISSIGRRVKGKVLKLQINSAGYYSISLCKNRNVCTKMVHQLVAIMFLKHTPNRLNLVVNHIDFNKLNNTVSNLEIITNRDNTNKLHIKTSSSFVGVSWNKEINKWQAQIFINRKQKYLGSFVSEIEAYNEYQKVLEQHKSFVIA